MGRGSGEQHRISVTYAEIEAIQPPPPVSPLKRWFQGPTRPGFIRLKNGDLFTLDVDREGETLLANARSLLGRS
jgi:hypothetical protein